MSDDLLPRIQRAARAMSPFSAEQTDAAEIEELLHDAAGALMEQASQDRPRMYRLDVQYHMSNGNQMFYRWPVTVHAGDLGIILSPTGSLWWHIASGHENGLILTATRADYWRPPPGWARMRTAGEVDHGDEEFVR